MLAINEKWNLSNNFCNVDNRDSLGCWGNSIKDFNVDGMDVLECLDYLIGDFGNALECVPATIFIISSFDINIYI